MYKLSNVLLLSFLLSVLTLGFDSIRQESFAQMRGEDSDRFFRQGSEAMEQQIREIQRENIRQQEETKAENENALDENEENGKEENGIDSREDIEEKRADKEKELETELEIQQDSGIEIREAPDNPMALDDNVPESPEQEIQIEN